MERLNMAKKSKRAKRGAPARKKKGMKGTKKKRKPVPPAPVPTAPPVEQLPKSQTSCFRESQWKLSDSDRHLEFLTGAEGDFLARLDLERLAGHRIATHASGAFAAKACADE
jgi:hypothetical protein